LPLANGAPISGFRFLSAGNSAAKKISAPRLSFNCKVKTLAKGAPPLLQSPPNMPHNRTTLSDIAARLNISKSAVSLALKDSPAVSAELREKVKKTARTMGYSRNELAGRSERSPNPSP